MRINHPRPALGRQHDLGLDFVDGVASVESLHPERELALLQHGYVIEADPEVEAPFHAGLGEPIIDLTTLTVPELREIAKSEGVELPAKALKSEIIDTLSRLPAEPVVYIAAGYEDGPEIPEGFGALTLDGEPAMPLVAAEPGIEYVEAHVEVEQSN